ncbi:3-hydroxyacyl-CoA dehydrogenase [Desulfosarcina widdelii]|uniref:3-hydroxyacyl-CoA dehydrogenase n=1 Tax=Desulfosarcina widdelii TaxID=947919 RepID=A0A5K7YYN6_9BACT|nr:3-hydroxyacyl-CoA dehydrogenase NAD-binding domain-containing protein [Desulfosarcina widdelii]BBO74496.1 3-hydroxyacyl-CoA dehydrogenase [Desulfosarcina widdelii]
MQTITEAVSLEKIGSVGMLWIDNPPVNALGYPVRKGLSDGIDLAVSDDEIRAIVIICKGRTFCAGADIKEMGKPPVEPHLPDALNRIDQSDKPVIAALHGTALGGGMETALACHFRVAVSSAKLGLPEVKLGLIPAAGGTQRLPRLIGPEKALNRILAGDPMDAQTAFAEGVIDAVVEDDLADAALAFAHRVLEEGKPLVRVSAMTDKIDAIREQPEFFEDYRRQIAKSRRGFEAPEACIKAVEAAVRLPFAEGCRFERELFLKLRAGDQSAAQRYYFFAERAAAKIPDIEKTTPVRQIQTAGIVGAGTMGRGIAISLIDAGIPVTIVEAEGALLDEALAGIRKHYTAAAAKGKIDDSEIDQRLGRIAGTTQIEDLADADLVVEAVYEEMALKQNIFSQLDSICKPDAILATNTSYLNVDEIAARTRRPESVLGFHFFSPAHVMGLIEIVRAQKTDKTVLATAMALAKRLKKIAVMVGVCNGFAANRMYFQRKRACDSLILEGTLPEQVDRVLFDFGFPMGPFALYDLVGNDLGWRREDSRSETIRELLCESGRLGIKAGKGYYNYAPGSHRPEPAPEIDHLIVEFSEKQGIVRRKIGDDEILERCIYPMINEGAKILEEKIVHRPSDLDVIWVKGFGWPLYRGGPMFYADLVGLDKILDRMKAFQEQLGDDFAPAPLLEQLIREGKGFGSLN